MTQYTPMLETKSMYSFRHLRGTQTFSGVVAKLGDHWRAYCNDTFSVDDGETRDEAVMNVLRFNPRFVR